MNTLENDITEAIFAAEDALQHLYQAKKYLKKASNWGIFDIFAGGFITSMIKHNHIDNAQDEIQYAKVALENLSRELQDVDNYIKVDIEIDTLLTTSLITLFQTFLSNLKSLQLVSRLMKQSMRQKMY